MTGTRTADTRAAGTHATDTRAAGTHATDVHMAGTHAAGTHTTVGAHRTPTKVLRELTFEAAKLVTGRKTSARVNSRGTFAAAPSQRHLRSGTFAAVPSQQRLRSGAFAAVPSQRRLRSNSSAAAPSQRRRNGTAPKTGTIPRPRLLPGVLVFATPGPRRCWQSPFGTRQSCPCASARACRCLGCPCRRR